jgi:hypothetical protein
MLSLATSRSKKPSTKPPDPNIRLGFGETAARRSFFFACVIFANVCYGPLHQILRRKRMSAFRVTAEVTGARSIQCF